MKLRAAVFDLNGTLVDDIAYHLKAWQSLAKRFDIEMDEARFQSFNGKKNEDILPLLLGREIGPGLATQLMDAKEADYRERYRPHLAPVKGAEDFFRSLRERGLKLGLASSSPEENRAMVLDGLGWNSTFDVVVVPRDLPGKPAPDIYLEAARRLEVDPTECVAFEDAVNGILAASAAKMIVVGVTTNVSAESLRDAGAQITIADFTDRTLAEFLAR